MKWCVWFCFIFSQTLWALPKEVEIWFLSEPKNMVKLQRWLDQLAATKFSRLTATNVNEHGSCQKMGEGFFHPQFGLHEHYGTENGIMANPIDYNMQDDVLSELDFVSNNEVDLINCDPNYQFDLFCGKAQDQIKNKSFDLEIWVDTSSSFIRIDRKDRRGDCYRKSFVKRVLNGCATKNVGVSVFDEHKKNNPELSGLCDSIGSNNQERLIKWIKTNRSKKLIILTDISELSKELADFLDQIGGKALGDSHRDRVAAGELNKYVARVTKMCL